jgi:Protein of unknown function (DUF3095)
MDPSARQDRFYEDVPVVAGFGSLMDPSLYTPLPDDWTIGLADIVQSTKAIAEKKYKAVNMAGAAVIAAVANALGEREFPFVFGGDGASFAVSAADLARAREALGATATWVKNELGLTMRVALIPLADIRARGYDVRVARFAPSPNVSYAMFSGGGLGWAEAAMKRGEFAVLPSPPGVLPDLSGLSCRFEEIPAANGVILSVLVMPMPGGDAAAFRALTEGVIALVENTPNAGRPVPPQGPPIGWPPTGMDLEARASRGGSLFRRRASVIAFTLFAYVLLRFGISVGDFVPKTYIRQVVENSDFRKYDDGLRMILDCTPQLADELEKRLTRAAAQGIARYGLHRQDAAMMTCFTPSVFRSDHVHFIDGAGGGYATAALALKAAA